jgi:hypothetical protein
LRGEKAAGKTASVLDSGSGPERLDLRLPAEGGRLAFLSPEGRLLDEVNYGPQSLGISEGRFPDGSGDIHSFPRSTSPGMANYLIEYAGPVLKQEAGGAIAADSVIRWVEIGEEESGEGEGGYYRVSANRIDEW